MTNKEKAEELLGSALKDLIVMTKPSTNIDACIYKLKDALAILKPCPTCGGSEKVDKDGISFQKYKEAGIVPQSLKPCPDCTESQEPTKEDIDNLAKDLEVVLRESPDWEQTADNKWKRKSQEHIPDAKNKDSEFVKRIEKIANALPKKPTPDETRAFFLKLIDVIFDMVDRLGATEKEFELEKRMHNSTKYVNEELHKEKIELQDRITRAIDGIDALSGLWESENNRKDIQAVKETLIGE